MKKTKTDSKTDAKPLIDALAQAQFETLCELAKLAVEMGAEIETLSREVDDARRDALDERRERAVELQAALLAATADAERLCRTNRGWFGEKKSLKLMDATLSFRESKSLVVPNEVATIALLKAQPALTAADFVRTTETLDREALEKLDDATLAKLGVTRAKSETFSLKALKTDLAKVAAAEPESEVAA